MDERAVLRLRRIAILMRVYKRSPGRPKGVPVQITEEWRVQLDGWLTRAGRGSQKDLAGAAGTSANTIGEIRRGIRQGVDRRTVDAISRHIGIEPPSCGPPDDILADVMDALKQAVQAGADAQDLRALAQEIRSFAEEALRVDALKKEYEERQRLLQLRFPRPKE